MSKSPRSNQWIVTEHRTIVVETVHALTQEDAMRCALNGKHAEYVVSDHMQRNIYPVHTS